MPRQGYNLDQRPGETLEAYYRRLAKTADQRLVRLESYENDKYFKPATQWAYAKAQKDLQKWTNKGPDAKQLRWNTKPPEGEDLLAKINDIKSFLSSPTSTKQEIIEVYQKRADTINKRYKTKFTWEQMAKFYESDQAEYWDKKFGSKTALKMIARIQKHKDKIKKAIEENDKKDLRVGTDAVATLVKQALDDNNIDLEEFL